MAYMEVSSGPTLYSPFKKVLQRIWRGRAIQVKQPSFIKWCARRENSLCLDRGLQTSVAVREVLIGWKHLALETLDSTSMSFENLKLWGNVLM